MTYFRPTEARFFVSSGLIKFDEFALDRDRYELLRAGRPVKLEKAPMELFAVNANAECGSFQKSHFGASLQQQSWEGKYLSSPASLLSVADSGEPIVGF